ncbi:MAG: hypothetical protein CME34_06810 [Gordonia sp.]|jgi:hypothetical protein|uniref:hypothetical protein n=1 Tax=Gordonia sp. (in: high G+C Gram-positive bacteria) TaxID=84139 RepID=UPI000C665C2C|nr:hypothetical protein [Gordonia sp. (in: high G+C Gram-positive bacteria)]MAU81569.1 hypothetical protein [Gordonia sp. (in: high G+C Gram-positive bacteria)]
MSFVVSTEAGLPDHLRRRQLYAGTVFCLPPRDSIRALADFALEMVSQAFDGRDPLTAHQDMGVEEYVGILAALKPAFTHHRRCKELLREILLDLGADTSKTYFDVPKLRVVPTASYLSSGLGYNYAAHRDTWYASPDCQNNWWVPVAGNAANKGMQFHPDFWGRPVDNSSSGFDAYEWNRTSRRDAAKYVTHDPRPHPKAAPGAEGSAVRVVGDPGSILSFSGAQLHSTVPNETDTARISFDFRTLHIDDLLSDAGPVNVDSRSTGTSVRDYLRADTFESLPDEVIARYGADGSADGVLVFDPKVLETN